MIIGLARFYCFDLSSGSWGIGLFDVFSSDVLEDLIDKHYWHRELEHASPLLPGEVGDLEDGWEWWHVEDHEVEAEGEEEGAHKPDVQPWWHSEDGLVLGNTVESVKKLDNDEHGESHGHWVWVLEDLAIDALELWSTAEALHEVGKLVPAQCWAVSGVQEPPGSREDSGESDVATDGAVSEEQPVGDESIAAGSWLLVHDVEIGWVEGESGGWETVGDEVDPEELDWNESFWDTESGGQEDADDLTDVGRDKVSDELLHVVVDGSALTNGGDNRSEVIVSENHVGGGLGNSGTGTHSDTDLGLLQGWRVVNTITSHGGDITVALEVGYDSGLVGWLDSGEESRVQASLELLVLVQVVELSAGVGFAFGVLIVVEDSDSSADGDGGVLVVTGDDDDSDTGGVTLLDGVEDLHSGWVEHTDDAEEGEVLLVVGELGGVGEVHVVVGDWRVVDGEGQASEGISAGAVLEDQSLNLSLHLSIKGNSLVTNSDLGTSLEHSLGGTLNKKLVLAALLLLNVHRHGLSVSAELESVSLLVHSLDLAVDGAALLASAQAVQVLAENVQLLNENGQSGLGGLTDLLVHALGGVEVDGGVVTEGASGGELDEVGVVGTLGGAVVGVVEGTLWLVGGTAHAVLSDVKLAVADRLGGEHLANGHLVSGQGTGLVGTDDTGAAQSLDRWQRSDDSVLLGHSVGTEGEASGDDGWETLWDSGNSQSNSNLEVVDSALNPATAVHWVVEVSDVDGPHEHANDGDHLGQLLTELVEFLGEWGLLSLGLNHGLSDLTDLGVLAGLDHNTEGLSRSDVGTTEEQVNLVLVDGSGVWHGLGALWNGDRLTSQQGLVDSEGGGLDLEDSEIGWDLVANTDVDHVTWHEVTSKDLLNLTRSVLSEDLGHSWLVLLESLNSALGVLLLPDTDASVGDENGEDDEWLDESAEHRVLFAIFGLFEESEHEGDAGGKQENSD